MKFSVESRQPYSVLKDADEIRVMYKDKEILMDFIEKIPNKDIVLELPPKEEISVEVIKMYQEKFTNFYIALHKLDQYEFMNNNNIQWYWPYPITTYFELHKIINLKPAYVLLGAPLCFDLPKVKEIVGEIKLRMVVNKALPDYLITSFSDINIEGPYVRPDDVKLYEDIIDVMEFEVDYGNYKKEEALLRIYKTGEYSGNLNLIIDNLNVDVDNRIIESSFGEKRICCGQKCLRNKTCRFCINSIILANNIRVLKYEIEKNNLN